MAAQSAVPDVGVSADREQGEDGCAMRHAEHLLTDARRDFAAFYAMATVGDTGLLDGLIMAHAALVIGMNTPRPHVATPIRAELEKVTDAAERVFTDLRESVRECPTFAALPAGERAEMERVLFEVRPA